MIDPLTQRPEWSWIIAILITASLTACVEDNSSGTPTSEVDSSTPVIVDSGCVENCDMSAVEIDAEATGTVDAESRDSAQQTVDMTPVDAQIPDVLIPPPPVPCNVSVNFISPRNETFHQINSLIPLSGTVTSADGEPLANVDVQLLNESGAVISTLVTNETGAFQDNYRGATRGQKRLTAVPSTSAGTCEERAELVLYLCSDIVEESFETEPEDWTRYGDATWNPGGWLEMTGISMGRKGAFYNSVEAISSGFASIEFTLTTGGGQNGGADGFAFTIVELFDSEQLQALLDAANSGGGLGYAVGGAYAQPDFELLGEALTVEIDTWKNERNGTTQLHTDPTDQNHIAITRNADAGDHLVWFEVPDVEDLQPHTIKLELLNDEMRILYDGQQVIEENVFFTFKGGYMFFSGSTGYATNYHRFDDLRILHSCR